MTKGTERTKARALFKCGVQISECGIRGREKPRNADGGKGPSSPPPPKAMAGGQAPAPKAFGAREAPNSKLQRPIMNHREPALAAYSRLRPDKKWLMSGGDPPPI